MSGRPWQWRQNKQEGGWQGTNKVSPAPLTAKARTTIDQNKCSFSVHLRVCFVLEVAAALSFRAPRIRAPTLQRSLILQPTTRTNLTARVTAASQWTPSCVNLISIKSFTYFWYATRCLWTSYLVSWCFKPSQPQGVTSGLLNLLKQRPSSTHG